MSEGESQEPARDHEAELGRMRLRGADTELRAAGAKAGTQDLDALTMLDEKDLAGTMEKGGAEKAVAKLREKKPWLFTGSISPAARVSAAVPVKSVDAMTMSYEQWRKARAALLRRPSISR